MAVALAAVLAAASLQGQAAGQSAGPQTSCTHFEAPWGSASYEVFMVFFDHDSSRITAAAAAILDQAATFYRPLSHCLLIAAAHTDRTGSDRYNEALSRRRAEAMIAYLRGRGVRARSLIEAFGETRPVVETADGTAEWQNRRGEVLIAPPDRR
ncbi:MAG TPA: OmpA family protein [Allosphingosinicella sp.]|nr:OmpA family protein [Allosphingosinicella sp.]HYG30299.1 OmpA family protein [Allosphingosinicella sp.]